MINIFIYDDVVERCESLSALIHTTDDMTVVGFANSCKNALQHMQDHQPDIVLMDINMPDVNGIEGLKNIKLAYPQIKVLMQTAFDDNEKIFNSIKNGASGYVLKSEKPNRVLQAIHEVIEGGAAMNPAIAQKVLDFFVPKPNTTAALTAKENQVLAYLADGLSYKMVADKMGITYSTVNTYTKRIYEKLHISSLGEAVAWFYKNA
jgi:DNA-binding NarL/FixJ family response regulator